MVEVLASQALADRLGLQVGNGFLLYREQPEVRISVRVAGLWRPRDSTDTFWFHGSQALDELLIVPESTLPDAIAPVLPPVVEQAIWFLVFDNKLAQPNGVGRLLKAIDHVQAQVAARLPNTTLDLSPVRELEGFQGSAQRLQGRLLVLLLPILGLVLLFIGQTGSMIVRVRRNEIAVMRSRGATVGRVLGLQLFEGLVLTVPATGAGLVVGAVLAQHYGHAAAFLETGDLTGARALPVVYSPGSLGLALMAATGTLIAVLVPALTAAQHTIVTYKQDVAQGGSPPFWQRTLLDVLLLAAACFGYYALRGRLSVLVTEADAGLGLGLDPLLFAAPTLLCLAVAVLAVRLLPFSLRSFGQLLKRLPGTALFLAVRSQIHAARDHRGPMILMILAVSLSIVGASMVRTMGGHLRDQLYYQIGTDLRLQGLGERATSEQLIVDMPEGTGLGQGTKAGVGRSYKGGDFVPEVGWWFPPVSEFTRLSGVQGATRVGHYRAIPHTGVHREIGHILGVDRADFVTVAFFRSDFASGQSLGSLMNSLALGYQHALVSRDFLSRHGLQVGDPLMVTVQAFDRSADVSLVVAGALELFPAYDAQSGPLFVVNLDYLHQELGGVLPYDVWLRLLPRADGKSVVAQAQDLGLQVLAYRDARAEYREQQGLPERQGVHGLLGLGLLATSGLAILGFLLHTAAGRQRRSVGIAVLRAQGLSRPQMILLLGWEQLILLGSAAVAGTGIGLWVGSLLIPYLEASTGAPPAVLAIAWDSLALMLGLLLGLFGVTVGLMVWQQSHLRLVEIIKLEETV
jgi:putative ABC transport system permease protein